MQVASNPHFTKTGTTIVGLLYKDGIILGADTRATAGTIVAEKNCQKIHYIADNIYCCGAGTAADTQWVTDRMASELQLMRLNSNRQSRVSTVVTRLKDHLYKYQGHVGAALILGGYDCIGPQLISISPNGYCTYLPYCTMGSGCLAAISVIESKYKDNLEEQEAINLVREAIEAGIVYDLGSGSNVDICVIKKEKVNLMRNYRTDNQRLNEQFKYKNLKNNTPYIRQFNVQLEKVVDQSLQMEVE
ncbi:proteasome subunit beta type 7-a precursor, putative [Ichthyophthirius multifiliis]|uniref:Proteasome subunit beta n=1 Tax=Ichthyophthirius multifiliis TaxID=5932 RepID=G0QJ07_ICHMU|nr:proteasome subunit beta type 7-a precursor, putative [Ichthyophthirius multifiliis]EGR34800.1 proteasome subunit beta type 7-a precursor, putative [Ichthyophthirius multifiliis]|eukprot:XP_004040104.1 proteasome subunit beta type 7-a precursor, putative [Ichthyophthirius multifiliis]